MLGDQGGAKTDGCRGAQAAKDRNLPCGVAEGEKNKEPV